MIGLKLTTDNKTFFASLKEGSIGVIISRMIRDTRNCVSVNFGGYDMQTETYPLWLLQKLFLGAKFTVKVEEITVNSPIIQRVPEIESHFFEHPKNIGVELTLKEEKLSAVVEKGSIHLIVTVLNKEDKTEIDLDFLATNHSNNGDITKYWCKKNLQLGDEFMIEIKEIEKMTLPVQS
ncbi:hypothetical protein CKY20_06415 [Capnocytophaga canis]|uniref:Uncharacterized protein n=1 Tax=Capnocytophaga canis TaxID=1848903 RepID=A0A3A1YHB2_9FLAO|nr:hypothetical protein [Capnocytophaga canis]RIY36568.1 hypothetical protein CKY20_06415 [Capnocytophaga canis]